MYSPSGPYKNFSRRTLSLLDSVREASDIEAIPDSARQLIFHAAIFGTSAAIESYIVDIVDSWANLILNKRKSTSSLHLFTRAHLLWHILQSQYGRFSLFNSERERLTTIAEWQTHLSILNEEAPMPSSFSAVKIYGGTKYPSSENLDRLFLRLGITNFFDSIGAVGHQNYRFILDSFTSIRTAIAHQVPPELTGDDVERNVKHIDNLGKCIDQVLYTHFSCVSGIDCWPT